MIFLSFSYTKNKPEYDDNDDNDDNDEPDPDTLY